MRRLILDFQRKDHIRDNYSSIHPQSSTLYLNYIRFDRFVQLFCQSLKKPGKLLDLQLTVLRPGNILIILYHENKNSSTQATRLLTARSLSCKAKSLRSLLRRLLSVLSTRCWVRTITCPLS